MFGKLVKYELKSVGKWYLGLYGLAFLFSIILRLSIPDMEELNQAVNISQWVLTTYLVSVIAIVVLIVAIFLSTLFIIIRRFTQAIYGREGYLTMTLPVTTHQLLLSKVVTALIWCLLNGLIILVSAAVISDGLTELSDAIWMSLDLPSISVMVAVLQWLLYLLLAIVRGILMIYLAISLGQLFNNRRILMAFVAYFTLAFLAGLLTSLVQHLLAGAEAYLFFLALFELVFIVLYYWITHYLIKHRLNLQ
ncbi:ABC transporter permease [Streptococcus cuniculipharyngis]|uniref:ABC transporter permease n=1 Tax=Streptococcus cuniculipharyngis TaxID=1562651 RepID=A0A5C5SBK3_9STRE|nr:ABC transporter permease [Streptococcus cuniculipharyngis]TWS96902.1 ABC transporter permease [Streptococcus cuniculipharyngis]